MGPILPPRPTLAAPSLANEAPVHRTQMNYTGVEGAKGRHDRDSIGLIVVCVRTTLPPSHKQDHIGGRTTTKPLNGPPAGQRSS